MLNAAFAHWKLVSFREWIRFFVVLPFEDQGGVMDGINLFDKLFLKGGCIDCAVVSWRDSQMDLEMYTMLAAILKRELKRE